MRTDRAQGQSWRYGEPRAITLRMPIRTRGRKPTSRERPTRATYSRARTAPVEELADELRDLAAGVSLCAAGLPPFGMLLRDARRRPCGRGEPVQDDRDPRAPARHGVPARLPIPSSGRRWIGGRSTCGRRSPRRGGAHERPLRQRGAGRAHLRVVPGGAARLLAPACTCSTSRRPTTVPTAAVTLGGRSRLLLNPQFVAENCPADHDLVMLVLHELHHVALGHTRLFARLTPAENWAFDCVINAQLCRLYPEAAPDGALPPLVSRRRDARGAAAPARRLAHAAGALAAGPGGRRAPRALQRDERDLHRSLPAAARAGGGRRARSGEDAGSLPSVGRLLGDHAGASEQSDIAPDVLREMRNILAEWPMVERISGRDQGGEPQSSTVRRARGAARGGRDPAPRDPRHRRPRGRVSGARSSAGTRSGRARCRTCCARSAATSCSRRWGCRRCSIRHG